MHLRNRGRIAMAALAAAAALAWTGLSRQPGCGGREAPASAGRAAAVAAEDGRQGRPDYSIRIETPRHTLVLFDRGREVRRFRVAVGRPGSPTPIGHWRVIEKMHWGGGFGGYWLGLDVPWGKYGIHGTTSPWSIGQNASGGCVRMATEDVAELFAIVPVGTPVTIAGHPFHRYGELRRIIRPEHIGSDVADLQRTLGEMGLYEGPIDGKFGPATEAAVRAFQERAGLPVTGEVDGETYARLRLRPLSEDPDLAPGQVRLPSGDGRRARASAWPARDSALHGGRRRTRRPVAAPTIGPPWPSPRRH